MGFNPLLETLLIFLLLTFLLLLALLGTALLLMPVSQCCLKRLFIVITRLKSRLRRNNVCLLLWLLLCWPGLNLLKLAAQFP